MAKDLCPFSIGIVSQGPAQADLWHRLATLPSIVATRLHRALVLRHRASTIRPPGIPDPPTDMRHPPDGGRHPPDGICHLPPAIRHLPFVICHLPFVIPHSEFRDPELGPLCMRDMLRNATFWGFFEILGNQVFDASF